jgi:hypothetical protein
MKPRRTVNPKRKLRPPPQTAEALAELRALEVRASYGGNPEHKRNPGDFGLDPPALPRQGQSLCDDAEIFSHELALGLIRDGIRRGLVSVQVRNGWPQNVWAVAANGVAVEGLLENPGTGAYHGYPMLPIDPLIVDVVARWRAL